MVTFRSLRGVIDNLGYNYVRDGDCAPIIKDGKGNAIASISSSGEYNGVYHLELGPKTTWEGMPNLFIAVNYLHDDIVFGEIPLERIDGIDFGGTDGLWVSTGCSSGFDINKINLNELEGRNPVLYRQVKLIAEQNSRDFKTNIYISQGHEFSSVAEGRLYSHLDGKFNSYKVGHAISGIVGAYKDFDKLISYLALSEMKDAEVYKEN